MFCRYIDSVTVLLLWCGYSLLLQDRLCTTDLHVKGVYTRVRICTVCVTHSEVYTHVLFVYRLTYDRAATSVTFCHTAPELTAKFKEIKVLSFTCTVLQRIDTYFTEKESDIIAHFVKTFFQYDRGCSLVSR